ncbi:carboxypeptidase-like regulatory domain-containing protein [Rosistilla carotiformis]|nr:carboxypeptidase-like regulatory domain-containing protein [Rosistilla carotiformis]
MKNRSYLTLSSFRLGLTFVALLVANGWQVADAKDVTLRGVVRDTSDNILPGVSIDVVDSKATTMTDGEGRFSVSVQTPAPFRLEMSKEGYVASQVTVSDPGKPIEAALAAETDDTGLIRYATMISMSHSVGEIRRDPRKYENRLLGEELFKELADRYGEKPAEEAVFRIYLPPGVPKLNGLFLSSEHGVGGPMIEHPMVRAFADRHRLALIGVLGNPIQRGIYPASALDTILGEIAREVNHPEIATAPLFTFGHSNGTGFSAAYAAMRPDRVIGWISFHSGASWHLVFPGVEKVPGLVMHGNQDSYFDQGQSEAVASLRTERNAPIALLVDGQGGHWPREREATYAVVLAFCEACLRIRLADSERIADGKPWPKAPLQPAVIESGWLGDRYDRSVGGMQKLTIASYADFQGDRSTANWLPDQAFAKAWQSYGERLSIGGDQPR